MLWSGWLPSSPLFSPVRLAWVHMLTPGWRTNKAPTQNNIIETPAASLIAQLEACMLITQLEVGPTQNTRIETSIETSFVEPLKLLPLPTSSGSRLPGFEGSLLHAYRHTIAAMMSLVFFWHSGPAA